MTQARFNYTGRYFRFVFVKLRTCFVFSVLFSAFCIPPFCIHYDMGTLNNVAVQALLLVFSLVSLAGLLAVTFVTPLIAMKHLYTKTMADNILSLPLTAAQRYFCELGAVMLCLAVPFGVISISFTAIALPLYLPFAIHGLLFMVMLCLFDIFLITLCGRLTEAILYPIALNILIPFVIWFGMHLGLMNIYGCGNYDFANYNTYSTIQLFWTGVTVLSLVSPFGNFIAAIGFSGGSGIALVTALIFIAVMIPLGLLTYSKRHSEKIGQSFVYKPVYAVTSVLVSLFAVVCYFWAAENYLRRGDGGKDFFNLIPTALPVLVGGLLLLMMLMEVVNYKKVKSLPKFLIRYAGVLAAGTLVSFVLYESDGFGESDYIPAAGETVFVEVSMSDWSREGAHETSMNVVVESDGALAEVFRSAHRALTEDRENGEKYEYWVSLEGSGISISYYMKNGTVVTRYYPTDIPAGLRETIVESEECRYSQLLMTDLWTCYDRTYSDVTYIQKFKKLEELEPVAVRLTSPAIRFSGLFDSHRDGGIVMEGIDYYELREALETDLRNDPNYGRHTESPIAKIELGKMYESNQEGEEKYFSRGFYTFNYTIYESYTNTLGLLRRYAEIPTAEEVKADILDTYDYFTLARAPVVSRGQDILTFSFVTYSDVFGFIGENNMDEALITGEQYLEALSHSAGYVRSDPERDYVYVITCGAPNAMTGTVPDKQLHRECFEWAILINEEFYDTLDEWYEQGYIPPAPETENTSLSVEYGCQAR